MVRPIPTSPLPATGTAATSGAALSGAGTGGAAAGSGSGAGLGNGSGSGDGDGARWTGGRITDRDYPRAARDAGAQGTTEVAIAVDPHGKVTGCQVSRSSGNLELDAATCRLISQRFRFAPARDGAGRAEPDVVDYEQEWTIGQLPYENADRR